ncbi:hypothetical protein GA0070216_12379 [Micromonospora matsumotoense]|uniref:Uncharacterized protein n=1 Tax=Micromonospora matsumotoense TaxID=121616 RepID=A0A1C5ARF1_9ACTN|nr:hypothetical protein GA0070216_12379 [Micromonospora matsumotoense]
MLTRSVDRLVGALLHTAARRWPVDLREEQAAEWAGEMHALAAEVDSPPAVRAWRRLCFAASLACARAPERSPLTAPGLLGGAARTATAVIVLLLVPIGAIVLSTVAQMTVDMAVRSLPGVNDGVFGVLSGRSGPAAVGYGGVAVAACVLGAGGCAAAGGAAAAGVPAVAGWLRGTVVGYAIIPALTAAAPVYLWMLINAAPARDLLLLVSATLGWVTLLAATLGAMVRLDRRGHRHRAVAVGVAGGLLAVEVTVAVTVLPTAPPAHAFLALPMYLTGAWEQLSQRVGVTGFQLSRTLLPATAFLLWYGRRLAHPATTSAVHAQPVEHNGNPPPAGVVRAGPAVRDWPRRVGLASAILGCLIWALALGLATPAADPAATSRTQIRFIWTYEIRLAAFVLIAVATALATSRLIAVLPLMIVPVADAIGSAHAPRGILPTAAYALLAAVALHTALTLGRRLDHAAPAPTPAAQRKRLVMLAGIAACCAPVLAEQTGHVDEIVIRSTSLTTASAAVATLLGVVAGACALAARSRAPQRRYGLPVALGIGAVAGVFVAIGPPDSYTLAANGPFTALVLIAAVNRMTWLAAFAATTATAALLLVSHVVNLVGAILDTMSLFWLVHATVGGWDWWLIPQPMIAHSALFGATIALVFTAGRRYLHQTAGTPTRAHN